MMDYALAFALSIGAVYWLAKRRTQKPYTTAEWCERMRELGIGIK